MRSCRDGASPRAAAAPESHRQPRCSCTPREKTKETSTRATTSRTARPAQTNGEAMPASHLTALPSATKKPTSNNTQATASRSRPGISSKVCSRSSPCPPIQWDAAYGRQVMRSVRRLQIGLNRLAGEGVFGAAVRALGPAILLDGQVDARVGVPQVHLRHGAGERQVLRRHLILVLRVRLDQRLWRLRPWRNPGRGPGLYGARPRRRGRACGRDSMDLRHDGGALAHRRGHALDRPGAHVPDREDAWLAGLERGRAPAALRPVLDAEVRGFRSMPVRTKPFASTATPHCSSQAEFGSAPMKRNR